jgi:hypothetical protein
MTGGGGLLQLVAMGKQDVFLTGNPQITWFKMVYRRYTNFSIESQRMYFDGDPDFGKRLSCLVPRRGDLLGPVFLEVTLPEIKLSSGEVAYYVNAIGHALIQEITVEIGEQEIDKQTGEWMEIWSNLTTTADKKFGFYDMIGKVDGYLPPTGSLPGPLKLTIPLHFWFNKNPGLYLPLVALQYHPVRINITTRPLQQLFYSGDLVNNCDTTAVNPAKITSMMLWGDYVHLDVEERRRFVSTAHEYLIEQVQYTSPLGIPEKITSIPLRLEFNHPLRELIWVIKRDIMDSYHEWFNYSSQSISEPGDHRTDMFTTAILQLDGKDRFEERDAGYFRLVQAWQHHTVVPSSDFIYTYSFALKPEELQPSGSLNASRIDNIVLLLTMNQATVPLRGNCTARVYATNHNVLRIVEGFGGLLFTI